MDPISAIVSILAAGAVAGVKSVASQAVADAYASVKEFLAGRIGRIQSLTRLEERPNDKDSVAAIGAELENKGLANDPALLGKVRQLTQAIEQEPPELLTAWGIDISQIRAAGSILVENIEAKHGGVRLRNLDAKGGDARIRGIKGGELAKKK